MLAKRRVRELTWNVDESTSFVGEQTSNIGESTSFVEELVIDEVTGLRNHPYQKGDII